MELKAEFSKILPSMRNAIRRTQYSVLDETFIAERIASKWGQRPSECEYWCGDFNDTYRTDSQGIISYLKLYRHQWRTLAEIKGEVELLRLLRRQGASVAPPIRKKNGAYIDGINAAEGLRYAVLFAEAKGSTPAASQENCNLYGRLAAKIHKLTDTPTLLIQRPILDSNHIIWRPLEYLRASLNKRPQDLAYLTDVSTEMSRAVESLLPKTLPTFGICHGDLHFRNAHMDKAGHLTLFDFDSSGFGWRAYDIALFLWSRYHACGPRPRTKWIHQFDSFLNGYHSVRNLTKAEMQAINLFVPMRQIQAWGTWARFCESRGNHLLYDDARTDSQLNFIKRWLRTYKLFS